MHKVASPSPLRASDVPSGSVWLAGGENTARQGLRLLGLLRLLAPVTQALTMLVAVQVLQVHLPERALWLLLGLQVLLAAATWARLAWGPRVGATELVIQVHVDILVFATVLYHTGGATNPFAPLFVLPMAITASAQRPRWVWVAALSTMVAYVFLRDHHVPLHHPLGQTQVYELHENGMVVNYLFTAALLAYFVNRMQAALLKRERQLAAARDAQMRAESVVAIGALAAGHAHEISTPLTTMSVVVSELRRVRQSDTALQQDLSLLDEQIRGLKRLVSELTQAAGRRRAEAASGARLDDFVQGIVNRARRLHPGTNIQAELSGPLPAPLVVAEETLRQAVTNLIDNAVQASPHEVLVRADWSGQRLSLSVIDSGAGFNAETLSQLAQTAEHGRPADPGRGLVLTLYTLDRLGGALLLRNRPEGGAHAEIQLPLEAIVLAEPRLAA
jgi:two-component system, sensor histidine kinase RegB